ncbi:MAG: 4-amino-4-deoxychorismate lyase [Planctomycetota bacterium]|nr:MAG: 4-amino-4-deoxychorismate lyase [Planctomycetota bacterium]
MKKGIPGREMTRLMLDGRLHDPADPAVPASWLALLRGEGIFETFAVEDGEPTPFLDGHEQRLFASAERLGMDLAGEGLRAGLATFLPVLGGGSWRVRHTVLRGAAGELHRMWSAGPLPPPPDEVELVLAEFRRDPADPLVQAKTISRAREQLARRTALAAGAWEALFLNLAGDLAEATSANLFVACHGVLRTPAEDQGILPGVTRRAVLDGCRRSGIPVEEGVLPLSALTEAEEVFLTNSVIGVIPVRAVRGVTDSLPGKRGTWLPRVRSAYLEWKRRCADAVPDRRST